MLPAASLSQAKCVPLCGGGAGRCVRGLRHLTSSAWFLYNAFSHPTTAGMSPPQCWRMERRPSMAVQLPTPEQVKAAATAVGLSLTDADIQSYIERSEEHTSELQSP